MSDAIRELTSVPSGTPPASNTGRYAASDARASFGSIDGFAASSSASERAGSRSVSS